MSGSRFHRGTRRRARRLSHNQRQYRPYAIPREQVGGDRPREGGDNKAGKARHHRREEEGSALGHKEEGEGVLFESLCPRKGVQSSREACVSILLRA